MAAGGPDPVSSYPIWAPDNARLAYLSTIEGKDWASTTRSIVIVSAADGRLGSRYKLPEGSVEGVFPGLPYAIGPPGCFRWSPDGLKILMCWSSTFVLDLRTGRFHVISTKPAVAEWSPSSDGVYYLEVLGHGKPREVRLGGMYFRQLASRRPAVLMDERALANFGLQLGSWIYGAMSLSPRGSKLAVTAGSAAGRCSVLHVYELRAGRLVKPDKPWLTVRTDEWVMAIDWSPDERAMAAVSAPPLEARARIQVLELASRSWKSVGAVDFAHEEERHAFSVRTLSWSR